MPQTSPPTNAQRMCCTWKRSVKIQARVHSRTVLMRTTTRPYETKISGSMMICSSGLRKALRSPNTALIRSHDRMR